MKNTPFGVTYVAFGRPYLAMALVSAESLRARSPEVPLCIITNVAQSPPDLPFWDTQRDTWSWFARESRENRFYKTQLYDYSPFEKTLYLDCDTLVWADVAPAVTYLEYFDICFKQQLRGQRSAKKGAHTVLDNSFRVAELPHWNGGVFMFRKNEKTREFFRLWSSYYEQYNISFDQVSLVDAVFRSDCRLLSLDNRWNASFAPRKNEGDHLVRVYHYGSRIIPEVRKKMLLYDHLIDREGPFGNEETLPCFIRSRTKDRIKKEGPLRYLQHALRRKFR
ncbi:putative nucleotide-diphospho-sugar transferase [Alkalispirochaeta alkalica]|uniref:putative nucleotide-diphospho-sugar transferase n=1 Tax=Alkalispirochaeta alkalica TaxID=46356 RepID=UPI00036CE50D|nr:putative nucleotide-diphospho-sugar transferase [Alkalispirochaeta alkalica]